MNRFLSAAAAVLIFISAFNYYSCTALRKENAYLSLTESDVRYVGKEACRSCHEEIYNDYLLTGMGKSFYRPSKSNVIEKFDEHSVVYDSFSDYYYQPLWEGNNFVIKEFKLSQNKKDTLYTRYEKIDYVVGSGHATRSYIIDRNGYLYEVPITWYTQKQKWDLSPGYENGHNSRFSRQIGQECMACHNGTFQFETGTLNRFTRLPMGIDCESCHGAGSAHVAKMEAGDEIDVGKKIDYSIVNPAKLSVEKSFDVCSQCHLQGVTVFKGLDPDFSRFRPGEDLIQTREVFLPAENQTKETFTISSQAERLRLSACFLNSSRKLTCLNCHNPHKSVHLTDSLHFIKACGKCHKADACTEKPIHKQTVNNNCIRCHMPKSGTGDIPHVSFTDHYIRVFPKKENSDKNQKNTISTQKAFLELLSITSGKSINNDLAGKAYLLYFERTRSNPEFLQTALQKLGPESRYERAKCFFYLNQLDKAQSEIQALTAQNDLPTAVKIKVKFLEGEIAEALNRFAEAAHSFAQVLKIKPGMPEAVVKEFACKVKAGSVGDLKAWEVKMKAAAEAQPMYVPARFNLGMIYFNLRQKTEARQCFRRVLASEPDHNQAAEMMKKTE